MMDGSSKIILILWGLECKAFQGHLSLALFCNGLKVAAPFPGPMRQLQCMVAQSKANTWLF